MEYTKQQLADITAQSPIKTTGTLSAASDQTDISGADRELLWAAFHDIGVLRHRSGSFHSSENLPRALTLAARPLSELTADQRRQIIHLYDGMSSSNDRAVRPLWGILTRGNRSPHELVGYGYEGRDSLSESDMCLLLSWALEARRKPQASAFFDAGPTIKVGSHLTVAGVTYAVRMRGGKPTLVPAEYPKPEAGQTWGVGSDQYLITDSGAAVNLGTAQLCTLEDFALPGTTRGQTFIRLK